MSDTPQTGTPQTAKGIISGKIQKKIEELIELVSREKFGEEGPPKELTFREIEEIGFEVGQLAAQTFESNTVEQHGQHFTSEQSCPTCGRLCDPVPKKQRQLITRLGPVEFSEIPFHCNACRRSFFPSAGGSET